MDCTKIGFYCLLCNCKIVKYIVQRFLVVCLLVLFTTVQSLEIKITRVYCLIMSILKIRQFSQKVEMSSLEEAQFLSTEYCV